MKTKRQIIAWEGSEQESRVVEPSVIDPEQESRVVEPCVLDPEQESRLSEPCCFGL